MQITSLESITWAISLWIKNNKEKRVDVKGLVSPKNEKCHVLLTLLSLKTCMTLFLLIFFPYNASPVLFWSPLTSIIFTKKLFSTEKRKCINDHRLFNSISISQAQVNVDSVYECCYCYQGVIDLRGSCRMWREKRNIIRCERGLGKSFVYMRQSSSFLW